MLEVVGLHKTFIANEAGKALDAVSLCIPEGAFFTLLGPSGCGKTTMLRSIAGLEQPDRGRICINGAVVFDSEAGVMVPANRRDIGMVFQSYAIWPHMDVFENVAFPLRVGRGSVTEHDIGTRVRRALASVQMEDFARRPATRLSGGQQQRVAMARALVMEPKLLLLDEPLSNLDAMLREAMRFEIRQLQRKLGITTVYVTHDQTEALIVSDVIAVMNRGRIVQQGDVRTIYDKPVSKFVAEFIGTTNLIPAKAVSSVRAGSVAKLVSPHGDLDIWTTRDIAAGEELMISIRPEHLSIAIKSPGGATNVARGRIVAQSFLGHAMHSTVASNTLELQVWHAPDMTVAMDAEVFLRFEPTKGVLLSPE